MSRRSRERANARPGSKSNNQSQKTTSTLATSQSVTKMSSQSAAPGRNHLASGSPVLRDLRGIFFKCHCGEGE